MPNPAPFLRTVTLSPDPALKTAAMPAFDCDNVLVSNTNAPAGLTLTFYDVDGATPTATMHLNAGAQQLIAAPVRSGQQRFLVGVKAFDLQPDSGTGPVVLMWT